jgi:hypothetical protein
MAACDHHGVVGCPQMTQMTQILRVQLSDGGEDESSAHLRNLRMR